MRALKFFLLWVVFPLLWAAVFLGLSMALFALFPVPAKAHYTPGVLHEHVPHLNCLVLWHKDRDTKKVRNLRARLWAQGYRLYFDGHCWLRPAEARGYKRNPCA